MRPPTRPLTAATLVAVATLAAACGGSTSAPSTTHPAVAAIPRPHGTGTASRTGHAGSATGTVPGGGSGSSTGSTGGPSGNGTPGAGNTGSAAPPGPTGAPAPSGASPGPGAAPTSPTTSVGSTTGSTTPGGATTGTGTLPVIAATTDGGFVSPDHAVACMIAIDPSDQVRCVSYPSAAVVVMTPDGSLSRCTGDTCALGSLHPGYKVLAYGTATGTDTFRCASTTAGVTCTVRPGSGFTVSGSGVRVVR